MSNHQSDFVFLFELFTQKNTFEVWRPLTAPPFPAGGLEFYCLSLNDSWVCPLFTCHLNIFRLILRSYCLLTDHVMDSSPPASLNYSKPVRARSLCYPPSSRCWTGQIYNFCSSGKSYSYQEKLNCNPVATVLHVKQVLIWHRQLTIFDIRH